ncbi:MAG: 2,3-bisphosphoglycerate-independent phosphoglycerate mutase [Desulfobacterium sp.]|nr:2,3-bisphosphoglycerate-independent phosphoglycerate mutase [Desulfobacterium sp.]
MTKRPVTALIILDGWGINNDDYGNAVKAASTPFLDQLHRDFPVTSLACSGRAVGLPDGIMGNSEVGHMNMGAGRRVFQDLVRINSAIEDGSFFKDPTLVQTMETIRKKRTTLHLMGLVSDGGVHSQATHLAALVTMAHDCGIDTAIHCITDGRDTAPNSGIDFVADIQRHLGGKPNIRIATVCGRFYAMDRDTRWDRIEKAYNLYTDEGGTVETDPVKAIKRAYDRGETDEFINPIRIGKNNDPEISPQPREFKGIKDGDGIIFFNFRADRAREITRAFTEKNFSQFPRKKSPELAAFVCMTQYDENFDLPVVFPPVPLKNVLGRVISDQGLVQLRIAETEKYAHVTYFFNGGDETVFPGEERVLIPSPREVKTYDLKPEMSAELIADKAVQQILSGRYDLVVLNFANMDMVGHTGIIPAAIKACEAVDRCAKKVVEAVWQTDGTAMITADHGNAEQMKMADGSPHTAHTLNEVPFILAGKALTGTTLSRGVLGDIAPTILKIMNLEQPVEMTGESLF